MKVRLKKPATRKKPRNGNGNGNGRGSNGNSIKWEEMKNKWIQGGVTYADLCKEFGSTQGAIRGRASADKWADQKKTFWADTQSKIREKLVEMFADAGLPPRRLVELLVAGALKTTKLQNVKSQPIVKGKFKPFVLDETITVTDNDNTYRYREMAVKLMDLFAAPKSTVKDDGGDTPRDVNISFVEVKSKRDLRAFNK